MSLREPVPPATTGDKLAAWGVHLLTASGILFALLAMEALEDGRLTDCLLWLGAALVIDGVDGTLARKAQVKTVLPRIDGEALDLIIDYINFVLIPALFIWRGGFLPDGWGLPLAALILLSSLYVFVRRDMKTEDGYFRGFPALWNVVALYVFALAPPPFAAALLVLVLVILTFAPVHVVHPFRVRDYGVWLPLSAGAWFFASAALLLPDLPAALRGSLSGVSLATAAVILLMGLLRTLRGPRQDSANSL